MPVIVGYPRSGNHFLIYVLQETLNISRDELFKHTHYYGGQDDVLYIVRNPTYVLYSNCEANGYSNYSNCKKRLLRHYNAYINKSVVVHFEKFFNNDTYLDEFKKCFDFIGRTFEKDKLDKALKRVDKQFCINNYKGLDVYYSKKLLTQKYADDRIKFIEKYDNEIREHFKNYSFLFN